MNETKESPSDPFYVGFAISGVCLQLDRAVTCLAVYPIPATCSISLKRPDICFCYALYSCVMAWHRLPPSFNSPSVKLFLSLLPHVSLSLRCCTTSLSNSHFLVRTVYQSSGDDNSNWSHWEKRRTCLGTSTIENGDVCGASCDFWNRYDEDLDRAASLGSNCFRLSLEWSRLQPEGPGMALDEEAVQRFHAILDATRAKGMEPFVTLHHFVHPMWFERMGAFEREENISLFVEYSIAAFREFRPKARFWATFNEPGLASFAGHVHGSFPPGKISRFFGAGRHFLNMLRAHTEAYEAMKSLPGGTEASIGIVHNWFRFEPAKSCCVPPYVYWIASFLNKLWGNDILLNYLRTGVFDWNPLG